MVRVRVIGVIFVVTVATVALQNLALAAFFPHLTRLTTDFSPAYLQRELRSLAAAPPQTLILGDSVLWGYRVQPAETAASILAAQGCACRNFSFKTGSPPNYYALTRLFQAYRIRPKAFVLEVNQKALNEADPAYRKLHPTLLTLAAPLVSRADRALLEPPVPESRLSQWLDRTLSPVWLLYSMRAGIPSTLFGDVRTAAGGQP